ncbi:hypothetical protein TNCV_1265301 [Trichonephila clavipes]|nr:hypothetical protein TNCV_1265301 [Trichonephila clavipes]
MPQRLNGAKYLFLQHILPELLQRISVNAHQNVSFMYNGALAHFLWQCVTTYMLHITGGGLDPTDLLLCSTLPEPQSLDFFLGNLKSLVIRPWRLQWRISWHGSSSLQLTSPTHRNCLSASDSPSFVGVGCAMTSADTTSKNSCNNQSFVVVFLTWSCDALFV